MGSKLVTDLPSPQGVEKSAPFSYTEVFIKQLPFYISIGMTPEQYWDGDCELAKFYRQADDIRRHRENEKLWLQGMYIYEAVLDIVPLLRFGSKETKPAPYPKEPYPITQKEMQLRKEKEERQRYEQMMAMMKSWKSNVNDSIVRKEK